MNCYSLSKILPAVFSALPSTPHALPVSRLLSRPTARPALRYLLAFAAATLLVSGQAWSQAAYPNRPIRLIVPLGAGGLGDVISRQVGEHAGKLLGQPIVVDNRPGAGGTLGSAIAATAAPDGYTILMGSIGTIGIAPSLYKSLSYNADTAFTPLTLAAGGQFFFAVSNDLPVKNLTEFLSYAKANPGKLNYGSQGNGSTLHLAMEQVNRTAGLDTVHVPFKTAPELATALVAGTIQVAISDFSTLLPLVRAGRVRALAVTSDKRSTTVPDIPTLAEGGLPGVNFISWVGFLAPAGTPRPIVDQLNAAMVSALNTPAVRQAITNAGGSDIYASSADSFGQFLARERSQWGAVVKALGVTAN